jgi:uncharacterized protein YecT (DUF1311 family)
MKVRARWGVGICCALICAAASAQAPPEIVAIDGKLEACLAKAGGVTPGVDSCNALAKIAADKILNRIYGAWIEQLKQPAPNAAPDSTEILKRLVAAERAWIVYRDTGCNLESIAMLGGTGETNLYGHCLYVMTRQRVLDLQAIQGSR